MKESYKITEISILKPNLNSNEVATSWEQFIIICSQTQTTK